MGIDKRFSNPSKTGRPETDPFKTDPDRVDQFCSFFFFFSFSASTPATALTLLWTCGHRCEILTFFYFSMLPIALFTYFSLPHIMFYSYSFIYLIILVGNLNLFIFIGNRWA